MSYCCICKSHSGSHADITFHNISRSEDIRAKWIAVIGKNVSNYSKVCSDHFKPIFFEFKINKLGKIQRHLIKRAIPTVEKCQDLHDIRELKSNNENLAIQYSGIIEDVLSLVPLCNADNRAIDNSDNSQNDSIRKRKLSSDKAVTCNKVRTIKFIGDLHPEDFTSPECYEVVRKYLKKHNTRVNSLQKQVGRLTKKVKSFEDLLSQLHDKGLLSSNAVDDLKRTISPALTEIVQNVLSTKKIIIHMN
ncbi:uncharacterized protein LOC114254754 [Monomorium pharaonis]|uniref:uncharacterized protein LOC114254754 n=1 Tax=Monomorium pharaonis TaxID=307658 RepID=UPI001747CAAD|nr:uncharacterized protein LOC114254754 [Monomorium pharaonis]